ncbi:MAG: hypothetical protein ISS57_15380 [Anaerolineales bacterium]|nr:hypothetical protein [Anaerolineales bacterium]
MVPDRLRFWFVVHFVVDMLFAVPQFIAPEWLLGLFGWHTIDPLTSRLVAAALFGIGIESFLGRNASAEAFRGMLNLKLIWSAGAVLGIGISIAMAGGGPVMGWVVMGIFVVFFLWLYYRLQLR